MYLAVWIDETKPKPRERIVLVTPLLKRLNAAVALLNSQKRERARSIILSGDAGSLNRFVGYVDAADDTFVTGDTSRWIDALCVIAAKAGCSVVPFDGLPAQVAGSVVLAAIKRMPKPGLYPRYITKPGKKLWDEVLESYARTVKRYAANKEKAWAAAILIFKRVAGERGIRPFTRDFGGAHRGKVLTEVHRRINRGNLKALKAVERAAEMLAKEKLGTRLTNERFYEAEERGGRYYLTTLRVLSTPDAQRAMDLLREKAWGGGVGGRDVHRAVDIYTDVLAEPLGAKKLHFYIQTHLTRDLMSIMFPTLEDADRETTLRTLGRAGRRWVRTGTMRAVAAVESCVTIAGRGVAAPHVIRVVLSRFRIAYGYRPRSRLNACPEFRLDASMSVERLSRALEHEAEVRRLADVGFDVMAAG